MASKKDFESIAQVLRNKYPGDADDQFTAAARLQWRDTVNGFVDALRTTNPRFDAERFRAACEGRDSTDSAGRKVRYSGASQEAKRLGAFANDHEPEKSLEFQARNF